MSQTASIDYGSVTKVGFLASAALLIVGVIGSIALADASGVPAWERTLFFDAEVIGTLGMVLIPITFGIVLPLVD
jgi:hypothetical protein